MRNLDDSHDDSDSRGQKNGNQISPANLIFFPLDFNPKVIQDQGNGKPDKGKPDRRLGKIAQAGKILFDDSCVGDGQPGKKDSDGCADANFYILRHDTDHVFPDLKQCQQDQYSAGHHEHADTDLPGGLTGSNQGIRHDRIGAHGGSQCKRHPGVEGGHESEDAGHQGSRDYDALRTHPHICHHGGLDGKHIGHGCKCCDSRHNFCSYIGSVLFQFKIVLQHIDAPLYPVIEPGSIFSCLEFSYFSLSVSSNMGKNVWDGPSTSPLSERRVPGRTTKASEVILGNTFFPPLTLQMAWIA